MWKVSWLLVEWRVVKWLVVEWLVVEWRALSVRFPPPPVPTGRAYRTWLPEVPAASPHTDDLSRILIIKGNRKFPLLGGA